MVRYEADGIDPVRHTGWSVIVTGTARLVTNLEDVSRYQQALEPWGTRPMDQAIAITLAMITGIRLAGWCREPPGDCQPLPQSHAAA